MIEITPSQDAELIKTIITTHGLYESITGGVGVSKDDWTPTVGHLYLMVQEGDTVYGLYDAYCFSGSTYFVHSALLPRYWGTGISKLAVEAVEQWLKEQGVTKTITSVPHTLRPVRAFLERHGFELEGYLKRAMIYNEKEVGVCMYGKYIGD